MAAPGPVTSLNYRYSLILKLKVTKEPCMSHNKSHMLLSFKVFVISFKQEMASLEAVINVEFGDLRFSMDSDLRL